MTTKVNGPRSNGTSGYDMGKDVFTLLCIYKERLLLLHMF
jgi:hypothetical protein